MTFSMKSVTDWGSIMPVIQSWTVIPQMERVHRIIIQANVVLQNFKNMRKNSVLEILRVWKFLNLTRSISDDNSVLSAIGQGTNNYTTSQLARYITAVANEGTVYNLSLLDKVTSPKGKTIKDYTPEVKNKVTDVSASTWQAVHEGMRSCNFRT